MTPSYDIKRRSSSHSAYWMSNALVPVGLLMMYRFGWAVESVIGLFFVGIGAVGYRIYKQKMSVPLISHDGEYLTYNPSAYEPGKIKMDSAAKFTVRELAITAESTDGSTNTFDISLLDFNSDADWQMLIENLRKEPYISLFFEH